MADEAVYKASLCKSVLDEFEKFELPADERTAVEKVMPRDLVEVVRTASKADWLPVRYAQDVWIAIHEICGADEARRFNRQYTHSATDLRIFGPLLRGAMTLFGGATLAHLRHHQWRLVPGNPGLPRAHGHGRERRLRARCRYRDPRRALERIGRPIRARSRTFAAHPA